MQGRTVGPYGVGLLSLLTAVVLATGALAQVASAVTLNDAPRDHTVTYCVESAPPGISVPEAKAELDEAMDEWEEAPGQNAGSALKLSRINCANDPEFVIVSIDLGENGPVAQVERSVDPPEVRFNEFFTWDVDPTDPLDYSYKGVLTHEMGHTFALGHSGNALWTWDTSTDLPTMAQCGSPAETIELETIKLDEWGGANWVKGEQHFWSADSGFEEPAGDWVLAGSAVFSTAAAHKGTWGLKLPSEGAYAYTQILYDPWLTAAGIPPLSPRMETNPELELRGWTRMTAGAAGTVRYKVKLNYFAYAGATCKRDVTTAAYLGWSASTLVATCNVTTSWTRCDDTFMLPDPLTAVVDAVAIQLTARSHLTSGSADVDRFGVRGGTDNS